MTRVPCYSLLDLVGYGRARELKRLGVVRPTFTETWDALGDLLPTARDERGDSFVDFLEQLSGEEYDCRMSFEKAWAEWGRRIEKRLYHSAKVLRRPVVMGPPRSSESVSRDSVNAAIREAIEAGESLGEAL